MFGVLEIVFRSDRIPARVRVARQLKIFLRDMVRIAANLHVGAVRFVRTRQRIGPATIVCGTPPHPLLILTRSHLEFLGCTSAISLQWGSQASEPTRHCRAAWLTLDAFDRDIYIYISERPQC